MMSIHVSDPHRDDHMWKSSMSDSDSYSDDAIDPHHHHNHSLGISDRSAVEDLVHVINSSSSNSENLHYHHHDDDDDDMDDLDDEMDKISSSPSIDDEDIDFNFVYALHTFVATVEGQANAAKGDTMVLLDDSNSYWWLVRVVKDNTIGYLPAEHIETPTERLARLNKHRNIDLAATMLGDTMEKSTNPVRRAMRRRGAKTVVFTEPTYVEASDYDYSSDEEDEMEDQGTPIEAELQSSSSPESQLTDNTTPDSTPDSVLSPTSPSSVAKSKDQPDSDFTSPISSTEKSPSQSLATPTVSTGSTAGGTVSSPTQTRPALRDTDSFFKDNEAETRKISLTPDILRDSEPQSRDALSPQEADKKVPDKKDDRKEKKSGILSNLFKRRAAKPNSKSLDDRPADEVGGKLGELDSSADANPAEPSTPERKPSRLTKNRDRGASPTRSPGSTERVNQEPQPASSAPAPSSLAQPTTAAASESQPAIGKPVRPEGAAAEAAPESSGTVPRSTAPSGPAHPILHYQQQLVSSMDLSDDEDEEEDEEMEEEDTDGDSASVPALVGDTSSQGEDESLASSPLGLKDMDDRGAMSDARGHHHRPQSSGHHHHLSIPTPDSSMSQSTTSLDSTSSSSSSSRHPNPALTFSSTRLLQFIHQPAHVRDLLLVVRDVDNVEPVPASHPMMADLFVNETKELDRIGRDLDLLLGRWFERRSPVAEGAGAGAKT